MYRFAMLNLANKIRFLRGLIQTRGNIMIQKLQFFKELYMPTGHTFLCKKGNIQISISLSLNQIAMKQHFF